MGKVPDETREDQLTPQNSIFIDFHPEENWKDLDLDIPGDSGIQSTIVVPYPDDGIDMTFSSDWSQVIETGGNTLDVIAQIIFGKTSQGLTKRFLGKDAYAWGGLEPVEVSMELDLTTYSDPMIDVVQPAFQLASTQMPGGNLAVEDGENAVTLDRPVEVSGRGSKSARRVRVRIGQWLEFNSVLPTEASPSFSGTISTSPTRPSVGYPLQATVSFSFIGTLFPRKGDFGFDINEQASIQEGGISSGLDADARIGGS